MVWLRSNIHIIVRFYEVNFIKLFIIQACVLAYFLSLFFLVFIGTSVVSNVEKADKDISDTHKSAGTGIGVVIPAVILCLFLDS